MSTEVLDPPAPVAAPAPAKVNPPSAVEVIKKASRGLRGTLVESLADPLTGAIRESDTQLIKFHGSYMQDDRDLRMELYQSEQHLMEMQLRADYYRARIAFLEEVTKKGIEQVSDQRKGQQEASQALRPGLKLTAAQ